MPKQCKYWYFEECPYIKDCSVHSWKRDNCGGKTPAMATEALQKHLVRSHKLSDEHATEVLCELCDEDMKICMMDCDDDEIDETQVDEKKGKDEGGKTTLQVEAEKKQIKVEESSPVTLCSNNKRKLDDSIQVKVEESDDEAKSNSVVLYENKKRKLDDTDLDKLLFDAANKVQQGLNCVAIAQVNMEEARDAVRRMQAVVDRISKSMPLEVN